ncbi:MAG: hypothetical protein GJ680_21075 [Alteromonadaceae bacterium]|nr:hypothetical protein [Alteromonadaceae bacterium]
MRLSSINFKKLITFICYIVLLCLSGQSIAMTIKVMGAQAEEDTSHQYFIDLLQLAAQKVEDELGKVNIEVIPRGDLSHASLIRLLNLGEIDVFWAGTNTERENTLLPIRIPLMRGLLGYRVSIIHKDNVEKFSKPAFDIQQAKACQLTHWPDFKILQDNGFLVIGVEEFSRIFQLTHKKRCDYFPRAIYEGYSELAQAQRKYPELTMYEQALLYYPFPMYYFTNQSNLGKARWIELALKKMIDDGSFEQLMQNHPLTGHLFPLAKWADKPVIHLENKQLPPQTPLDDKSLWLQIGKK